MSPPKRYFPPKRYSIGEAVSFQVRGVAMTGQVIAIEPRADASRSYLVLTASGERFSVDEWSVGGLLG